jgi:glycosyltransferase involved in cell wall biosynthesis
MPDQGAMQASDTQPVVSIITPAYNRASLIEETIDSILGQDYPRIELIVIDDGSTDQTLARLQRYQDRARIITRPNKGEGATVNEGFALATGKYVCVVNSDDPILPQCISTLVRALEARPDALVAYGDWAKIDAAGRVMQIERLKPYATESMLADLNFSLGPGTLIRRSAIQQHGPRHARYRYAGDMEFFLRLSLHGALLYVPALLATHRAHPDSASVASSRQGIGLEMVDAFQRCLSSPAFPPALRARRYLFMASIYRLIARSYAETLSQALLARIKAVECLVRHVAGIAAGQWYAYLFSAVFAPSMIVARWCGSRRPASFGPEFCFSTRFLPPMWSGQAVVIQRLLRDVDPARYRLVGHPVLPSRTGEHDFVGGLPARYYDLPAVRQLRMDWMTSGGLIRRLFYLPRIVCRAINLLWGILQRARQIASSLEHDRPALLIACTGDQFDPPATWLAAKMLGSRIGLYYFDDYSEQWWADRETMPLLGRIEAFIGGRTDAFIAPNEMMQAKLEAKFGVPCHIVRNPMGGSQLPPLNDRYPSEPPVFRLVFTGAVYHLNYQAFRLIIQAIALLSDFRIELHLYTAQPRSQLEAEGIVGPAVAIHPHASPDEVVKAQSAADVLLIPFSDDGDAVELVRTSATAKLADYLATGRPVLAIAERDAFLTWFLEGRECGVSVSTRTPEAVAEALETIFTDEARRRSMSDNARRIASELFSPETAADDLLRAVATIIRSGGIKLSPRRLKLRYRAVL